MKTWFREHPILGGLMLGLAVGGAALGALLGPGDWSLARRASAGLLAGGGVGIMLLASRILGAFLEPEEPPPAARRRLERRDAPPPGEGR